MRKKCFAGGGEVEPTYGEDERSAPIDASEATKLMPEVPKAEGTFGSAFKAARSAGDKTFMWKGKKYTTDLAKPTVKAPKQGAKSNVGEAVPNIKASPYVPPKRGFYENAQRAEDQPETKAELTRESRRGETNDKTTAEVAAELKAKRIAKNNASNPSWVRQDEGYAAGGPVRGMGKAMKGGKKCRMY